MCLEDGEATMGCDCDYCIGYSDGMGEAINMGKISHHSDFLPPLTAADFHEPQGPKKARGEEVSA